MTAALTYSHWDKETGGLEVAKAFSAQIQGKNVLITGVSPESIGSSIALSIASQSPNLLILASRTRSKIEEVATKLNDTYPNVSVHIVLLNLMSQEAVKQAAADVAKLTQRLDIIINNAASVLLDLQHTVEGIEAQFGSSHIGHFLFTNLLMNQLFAAANDSPAGSTRVINLTSIGHRLSPIRFHDYNFEGKDMPDEEKYPGPGEIPPLFQPKDGGAYNGFIAYGQAKTANILFSVSLTDLLRDRGIVSYAVHPGSIWTGLSRNLDAEGEAAIRKTSTFWKNHDQGAATVLVAAFDPALNTPKGALLHDCQLLDASPHATDPEIARRLWTLSEQLVGKTSKI